MTREVKFFGIAPSTGQAGSVEQFLPLPRVWPDVDMKRDQNSIDLTSPGTLRDVMGNEVSKTRAICLHSETDWDMVRVRIDDEPSQLLVPGQVLYPKKGTAEKLFFEPPIAPPQIRQGLAGALGYKQIALPSGIMIDIVPGVGNLNLTNRSGFSIQLYKWVAGAWVANAVVGDGLTLVVTGGAIIRCDAQVGGGSEPPAGYTVSLPGVAPTSNPTWTQFNLADFIAADLIKYHDGTSYYNTPTPGAGVLYVMANGTSAFDSNGNFVDQNATALYKPPGVDPGLFSSLWLGRLAVEVWRGEGPPLGYAPKLAPFRHIHFGAISCPKEPVLNNPEEPTTVACVFPSINVERMQFTFEVDSTSPGQVMAAIGSPLASIHPLNMLHADGTTRWPWVRELPVTVDPGKAGAAFHDDNCHPYGLLAVGSPNAGGTTGLIRSGGILTLRRQHCG